MTNAAAVGRISDALTPKLGEARALRQALLYQTALFIVAAVMVFLSIEHIPPNVSESAARLV